MHSPNKAKRTTDENAYIAIIKAMPCICCGKAGPSEAHEIVQGLWWLSIPVCADCHRGSVNGIHGQKAIWKAQKKTVYTALNEVNRMLHTGSPVAEFKSTKKPRSTKVHEVATYARSGKIVARPYA